MINPKKRRIQYSVTVFDQKKYKSKFVRFIAGVLIVVFFLSCFMIAFNKGNVFDSKKIFIVVAGGANNSKPLDRLAKDVKEMGGAGEIFESESGYFVAINVYRDRDSANNVLTETQKVFKNAKVVSLVAKKIKKKTVSRIKKCETVYEYYRFLEDVFEDLCLLQMQFMLGKITDYKICSNILAKKLKLEEIVKNLERVKDDWKNIYNNASLLLWNCNYFLDNVLLKEKKQTILCEFVLKVAFCVIESHNNL